MNEIERYSNVVVTKDLESRSSPSISIKKGTVGIVLDLVTDPKTGATEYLVELDNNIYGDGEIQFLRRDEIDSIKL